MTATDILALLPLIVVAGTAILVMLATAIGRNHRVAFWLTWAGLAATFCLCFFTPTRQVTELLTIDGYSLFFFGLITAATMGVVLLSYNYLKDRDCNPEEYYILLLVATLGAMVLSASSHFASFFLGLEILSVALYALIAYLYQRPDQIDAGIKYLVLAATSAAFMLFGMALVYAALGTMQFSRMAELLSAGVNLDLPLLLPGIALIVTGVGFKLAVVPFHMWAPDIYDASPAPATAFIATVSKGGMFALLLRYFPVAGAHGYHNIFIVFSIIAIASMFAGNLLALFENNVKRILAYSSIAHLGFLLVAFQAASAVGRAAAMFYLVAYFAMTVGAFGVVTVLSARDRDASQLEDYVGLFWKRPALALTFTGMLLALAGAPLTVGFLGEFYILAAGASAEIWALIILLVVAATIGLFFYLRVIVAMFRQPQEQGEASVPAPGRAPAAVLALAIALVLVVWLGVFPSPLLKVIQAAAASML